ncbi:hypothetical protein J5N97_009778 [Dioscorea zingiberensis]|uniref:Protein TIC 20 n=1 Tax=Dioscorea zingiberensis TaxID=325984 RepID=A0A9D5CY66_9LILI|nr:hypothetical protein J5N97_009778 [Dioscorea zingiberensis]
MGSRSRSKPAWENTLGRRVREGVGGCGIKSWICNAGGRRRLCRSLPLHLLLGRCRRRRPQSLPYYQERRLLSLFAGFPPLAAALEPILTLIAAYRSVPYAAFVVFFALYLGVVNSQFSRYVRFNAMQAVVLDVFLALLSLIQRAFNVPTRGLGFRVLEIGYGTL